jgi:sulfur-oxidizing protein SoxZ
LIWSSITYTDSDPAPLITFKICRALLGKKQGIAQKNSYQRSTINRFNEEKVMAGQIQIRARMISSDVADVKILLTHDMETGTRKDPKTKNLIPAHHISELTVTLNGKPVMQTQWGGGIAKNPFLGLRVKGAKSGDFVAINAVDNLGTKFEHNAIVI